MNYQAMRSVVIGLILLGSALPGKSAVAGDYSFRELSAEWWQWALSIPSGQNPILDETGKYCMVGQRGDTWFLSGTFNGNVSRSCDVPKGVALFLPVINSVQFDSPNECGQGPDRLSIRQMRANNGGFIDAATNISVELDGRSLTSYRRADTDVFAVAIPDENFAGCTDSAVFRRSVADGYYLKLVPLNEGLHSLHFHAENLAAKFFLDVTYSLNVNP